MECHFVNRNRWQEAKADGTTAEDGDEDLGILVCIERFYSTAEEKAKAVKQVLGLLNSATTTTTTTTTTSSSSNTDTKTKTLELVAGNSQLLSALTRIMREDCVSSDLCQVFLHLSLFPEYHPLLLSHGIGSLLMDHVIREVKRARRAGGGGEDDGPSDETRDDQSWSLGAGATDDNGAEADAITCGSRSNSSTATASTAAHSSSSHRRRPFSSKQEKMFNLCLAILDNLADDLDVRREMFKSGQLVAALLACLTCKTTGCIIRSLLLLRKASMFEEVVAELSENDGNLLRAVIHVAMEHSAEPDADAATAAKEGNAIIADHAIRLLFNASFHKECRTVLADDQGVIDLLTSLARDENSSSSQVCKNLLKVLCLEMLDSCTEESNQLCLDG